MFGFSSQWWQLEAVERRRGFVWRAWLGREVHTFTDKDEAERYVRTQNGHLRLSRQQASHVQLPIV